MIATSGTNVYFSLSIPPDKDEIINQTDQFVFNLLFFNEKSDLNIILESRTVRKINSAFAFFIFTFLLIIYLN